MQGGANERVPQTRTLGTDLVGLSRPNSLLKVRNGKRSVEILGSARAKQRERLPPRLSLLVLVFSTKWTSSTYLVYNNRCGKNYQAGSPTVAPGGEFPIPSKSSSPLLAFRCSPAIKPYLPEDASASQTFVIDAPVVYSQVSGAAAITLPSGSSASKLEVTVTINGKTFATGSLAPDASTTLSFSLKDLTPQATPYDVQCTAKYGSSTTFTAKSQLSYLPAPPSGRSVTKMDLRTGALLAKPASGKGGNYQTVFPFGFYTSFDYLSSNLANIDSIAAQGYTVVRHTVSALFV